MNNNQRTIIPVTTWVNGETKTMSVLQLDNYSGYNFTDSPGFVTYTLCVEAGVAPDTYYEGVTGGVVYLTWPLVENWGTDDQPIFDYVAEELNIQLL